MKLYYLPGACSLTIHIALEWTKSDYAAEAVARDALKQTEFLKLNPLGSVPCLVDGDFALTQNVAILEYLNEKYPQAMLLGSNDMRERAEARRWLLFCNSDLHGAFVPLFAPARYIADESTHAELQNNAKEKIMRLFGIVNQHLETHDYLSGQKSVADAYLFVILGWADKMGLDLHALQALGAFKARMAADSGVQAALKQEGLL